MRKLLFFGLIFGSVLSGTTASAATIVSLTFDDGYSDAPVAQQTLDAYGMKGTFYIISGVIGTPFHASQAQIQTIRTAGHEIGGHTLTHADLITLSPAQQQAEVCDDRAALIGMGFQPISFAYPFGNSTPTTESIVSSCGYTNARGAWNENPAGHISNTESIPPEDPFWIRTPEAIDNTTSSSTLMGYVTAAENSGGGWVVLQFHHVCSGSGCDPLSVSTTTLNAFLTWLQPRAASGTVVQTVAQVMGGAPIDPIPAITTLSPSSATVGGAAFTLTVNGVNFLNTSVIQWNGSPRLPTTFVNSTRLTATIPASDLAAVKIATITVSNGSISTTSPGKLFTVGNPLPVLTTLSSTTTLAGSPAFTLTVTGSNFVSTSTVRWNGSSRITTFVSSTTLNAAILASDLTTARISSVTVFNPTPGGGTSTIKTFIVANPVPVLTALSSTFTVVGSSTFTLTLTGSNFVSSSTVRWNGAARTTAFVNSTTLNATIPSSDLTTLKIASVTVFNAAPGGGVSSTQTFTVGSPVPVLTTLSSTYTLVGSPAFTLTLTGSNFIASSIAQWNGSARPTTFINSTTLTASIPASDLSAVTIANVNVFSPGLGGGTTANKTFTVGNPVPVASALSSTATAVGSSTFTLTVTGSNFVASSIVQWNGSARTTTFVSSTTLNALIPASDLAVVSFNNVTVFNPAPGGGTSNAQPLLVGNPGPGLLSLSPNTKVILSPTFTMTVTGLNFVLGSVVQWNGSPRTTSFTNSTTLTVLIPASDLTQVSVAIITVVNPAPGGGISGTLPFIIADPVAGGSAAATDPTIVRVSPTSVLAGVPAFTMTIIGTNFASDSSIRWNGSARTTHFFSSTLLTADIPATDVSAPGTASVFVFNPSDSGTSASQNILIGANAARVHPNPWRANLHTGHDIVFDTLPANSTVKIFTPSAHSVITLSAPSGSVSWNLKNDSGDNVASGYYIYLITTPSGSPVRGVFAIIR